MSDASLHLHFTYKGQAFDFDLQEQAVAPDSIVINGHTYALKGTDSALLKALVPELTSSDGMNFLELKERLWSLRARDIRLVNKTYAVAPEQIPVKPKQGNVIVLVGTSSAGKTTIMNALRSMEPEREELGTARTSVERIYRHMTKHYKEYGILQEDWEHLHRSLIPERGDWHIHGAIFGRYKFKPGLCEADQVRVRHTATALRPIADNCLQKYSDNIKYLVDKSLKLAKRGKDVIFDTVNPDEIYKNPLISQSPFIVILVYCPFHSLSERAAKRNKKALEDQKPQEGRVGIHPFFQFAAIFGPRKATDTDADVIDRVSKITVEEDFDLHFNISIEKMKIDHPELFATLDIEEKRIKERDMLLALLGFQPSDPPNTVIEFTSRRYFDPNMRINTNDTALGDTPEERGRSAAARILALTQNLIQKNTPS